MNRYLIFRTDRIGDFIFSRMLTESIKNKNPNNEIDFVCSSYNSKYIKNFKDINKIYILDKYDLKMMIKNLKMINQRNYDYLVILDGKRRSIFFSLLLKAKNKYAILKDFRPYLILKIFFDYYFVNSEVNSQFNNFSSIINYLNIKVPDKINYYSNYKLKKNSYKIIPKDFILLHLDEKWFEGYYYNDFKYMNLNIKNFDDLIRTIKEKFKKNIVITSGKINIEQFNIIKDNLFDKLENNVFVSKKYKKSLIFIDNTDFRDLEQIVSKSCQVICCEGAISHVSNALNKNTYALINNFKTAKFWTNHMKKLKLIKRENIKSVCRQILSV